MTDDFQNFDLGGGGSVIVTMPDGTSITLENASISFGISQERLDHYSMIGGERMRDNSAVISQEFELQAISSFGSFEQKTTRVPTTEPLPTFGERRIKFRKK